VAARCEGPAQIRNAVFEARRAAIAAGLLK